MVRRTRKIEWSIKSRQDRKEIYEYWANRNKSTVYSRKLAKLFLKKSEQIAQNPFLGRLTEKENVRTVLVRDCLIIYEIYPVKIVIVGIWEGHQNPQNFNY